MLQMKGYSTKLSDQDFAHLKKEAAGLINAFISLKNEASYLNISSQIDSLQMIKEILSIDKEVDDRLTILRMLVKEVSRRTKNLKDSGCIIASISPFSAYLEYKYNNDIYLIWENSGQLIKTWCYKNTLEKKNNVDSLTQEAYRVT